MSMPARSRTARTATSSRTVTARTPTTATGPVRRTGPVAVRPQLRLVDPQRAPVRGGRTATRSRRAPFVLLVVGLIVATALGLLALNTAVAVDSLDATRQETANKAAQERVDRLEQQVVSGGTTAELARRAAENGLVPAGVPGHLVLDPDGTSRLQGAPSPAPAPAPAPVPAPVPAPDPAAGVTTPQPSTQDPGTQDPGTQPGDPAAAAEGD